MLGCIVLIFFGLILLGLLAISVTAFVLLDLGLVGSIAVVILLVILGACTGDVRTTTHI